MGLPCFANGQCIRVRQMCDKMVDKEKNEGISAVQIRSLCIGLDNFILEEMVSSDA
jgi:hypothetical protein